MVERMQTQGEGGKATQSGQAQGNGPSDVQRRNQQQQGQRGTSATSALGRQDPRQFPAQWLSPVSMLEQMAREMDHLFDAFGLGRSMGLARPFGLGRSLGMGHPATVWSPRVDLIQRERELVVRADLPGMDKSSVHLETTQEGLVLSGAREDVREQEEGDMLRAERTVGMFYRVIPLPEGARVDDVKATFNKGVLEVVIPLDASKTGRRIEIQEEGTGSRQIKA
jgi:HSP20 family protein